MRLRYKRQVVTYYLSNHAVINPMLKCKHNLDLLQKSKKQLLNHDNVKLIRFD